MKKETSIVQNLNSNNFNLSNLITDLQNSNSLSRLVAEIADIDIIDEINDIKIEDEDQNIDQNEDQNIDQNIDQNEDQNKKQIGQSLFDTKLALNLIDEINDIKIEDEDLSHKKMLASAKTLSKTICYSGGTLLVNYILTDLGYPPLSYVKPLIICGINLSVGIFEFTQKYPNTTAFLGPLIPITGSFAYGEIKKHPLFKKTKTEETVLDAELPDDGSGPKSIFDVIQLVVNITYKALKYVHDLF